MAAAVPLILWTCALLVAEVAPTSILISLNDSTGMQEFQEYFGCNGITSKMTDNTVLEITGRQNQSLFQDPMFCLLSNLKNITIRSSSSEQVTLSCLNSTSSNRTGLGFYNISNLTLENIRIDGCGGIVVRKLLKERPGVSFFSENKQTVITISMSTDVQLQNVEITNYLGYAIIGHTVLGEYRIEGLSVKYSYAFHMLSTELYLESDDWVNVGSGVVFRYRDTDIGNQNKSVTIVMSDVELTHNRNLIPYSTLSVLQAPDLASSEVVLGGNGVILASFSNIEYGIEFMLRRANVSDNFGTIGGGITMIHFDSILNSNVTFEDCQVKNNMNRFSNGGGIELYYVFANDFVNILCSNQRSNSVVHNILIVNSVIHNNHCPKGGGGLYALVQSQNIADVNLRIINTHFMRNSAQYGDGLAIERDSISLFKTKELNVFLDSVTMDRNGRFRTSRDASSSCMYVTGLTKLLISGSEGEKSHFHGHSTSVIRATASHVYLNGSVAFKYNKGLRGGALSLSDDSHLFFINKSRILFAENYAEQFGGAIYIDSLNGLRCEIQFISDTFVYNVNQTVFVAEELDSLDYSIVFSNNTAPRGNSIFGRQIYNCTPYSDSIVKLPLHEIDKVYQSLFTFEGSSFLREVRSRADKLCFCSKTAECLDMEFKKIVAYPGLDFTVSVLVVDVIGQPLIARVRAYALDRVTNSRERQPSYLINNYCTTISYSIRGSANSSVELSFYSDYNTSITAQVLMLPCPIGFSNSNGRCYCTAFYGCTIQRTEKLQWVGLVNTSENQPVLAYSSYCPLGYCNNEVTSVSLRNSSSIRTCMENRQGFVCGTCEDGCSNVFGSNACVRDCSSWWLLSTLLYMVVGILLVLLIHKLDLTVTKGTINGIVFYAQMTAITINFLSTDQPHLATLVRFINLEIGIPFGICFYREMSSLSEYAMQFVFPLYLGFLVILTVFLGKCNKIERRINFSNAVNVMVTLIYLSYGKILTTIVFLLTPLTLEIDNGDFNITERLVWYYDARLQYFQKEHLIVGIVAVGIALFFIVPYLGLILFSQWCLKFKYLAYYLPVVDANVAPFKHKYRFWFGMRLIITAVLVTESASLFTLNPQLVSLINVVVLICLLMIQAYVQPFKSAVLNWLDLSFLVNLIFLYIISISYSDLYLIFERISASVALLTFCGILIYHTFKAVKKSKCFKKLQKKSENVDSSLILEQEEISLPSLRSDDYDSQFEASVYDQYRDSVLEL